MTRIPLTERSNSPWTEFESFLFNLVTKKSDRVIPGYFSMRLELTQVMLDAFDKFLDSKESK